MATPRWGWGWGWGWAKERVWDWERGRVWGWVREKAWGWATGMDGGLGMLQGREAFQGGQ